MVDRGNLAALSSTCFGAVRLLQFGVLRGEYSHELFQKKNLEAVARQLVRYSMCLGEIRYKHTELLGVKGTPGRMTGGCAGNSACYRTVLARCLPDLVTKVIP